MKIIFLTLTLPFVTIFASGEELSFTKSLPVNSKPLLVDEKSLSSYDNRIIVGPGIFNTPTGVSYARIKPDSAYVGISTYVVPNGALFSATGGYNFLLSPRDVLSCAAGAGHYARLNLSSRGSSIVFPIIEFKYEHAFNSSFSIGADFGTILIRKDVGISLSVPAIFRFGQQKNWELRITPYLINPQRWSYDKNLTTLSASIGYRY